MLENLYTTKMSADKKTLQNRFAKIRRKSGRISKIAAAVMSCAVAVTMLGATVVMAAVDAVDKKVTVYLDNKSLGFTDEPFFYKNTAYVPLRETFQRLGVFDDDESKIIWNNGKIVIDIKGHSDFYEIGIGDNKIIYDGKAHEVNSYAVREEPCGPLLMNDVTYIPFEYIDYILNRDDSYYSVYYTFADINSEKPYLDNAENFTYSDICRLQYVTDNGHFPWRLDTQQVIKNFFGYTVGDGNGEISNFFGDGTKCAADYTVQGKSYTVQLFKTLNKTESGIWVVKAYEERS